MGYSSPHLREIFHYNLDQDYNNTLPITLSKAKNQISYQLISLNQFLLIELSKTFQMIWICVLDLTSLYQPILVV
jgi:hypothetical protein